MTGDAGPDGPLRGEVVAVCRSPEHTLSKPTQTSIHLQAGLGVEGDAHAGTTVKHRSRVRADPSQPNLRQLHLLHAELHDELRSKAMPVEPGQMGENVTTRGLELMSLPEGSVLRIGRDATVRVTGLRNPCAQLDSIHEGLMAETVFRGDDGALVRRAGIMAVVLTGGDVRPGDEIEVVLPDPPHRALERV